MKYLMLMEIDLPDSLDLTGDLSNTKLEDISSQLQKLALPDGVSVKVHKACRTIECDAETCRLSPNGVCLAPAFTGKDYPAVTEDGCEDYIATEKI